jgi:pimeloyl-ACP methyl ester carboxylesterase
MKRNVAWLAFIAVVGSCVGPRLAAAQVAPALVPGTEFAAGANLTEKNVKAEGTIFVPDKTHRVRAVIVLTESWPGPDRGAGAPLFRDLAVGRFRDQAWRRLSETCECALLHLRLGTIRPDGSGDRVVEGVVRHSGVSDRVVRNAAEGGADALLVILQRLGEDSAHKELKDAPLLLWGWSATASFGTTFAALYPERTVAFVRYHTHRRGLQADLKLLRNIPALLIAGGKDQTAGTEDAETLWKSGRSAGAPWTFAIEPGATHASEETFVSSHELMIPWIAAVLGQRLAPGSSPLRRVTENNGWLGNNHSAEVAPHATFAGPKEEASWLPDEVTARGWQTVLAGAK